MLQKSKDSPRRRLQCQPMTFSREVMVLDTAEIWKDRTMPIRAMVAEIERRDVAPVEPDGAGAGRPEFRQKVEGRLVLPPRWVRSARGCCPRPPILRVDPADREEIREALGQPFDLDDIGVHGSHPCVGVMPGRPGPASNWQASALLRPSRDSRCLWWSGRKALPPESSHCLEIKSQSAPIPRVSSRATGTCHGPCGHPRGCSPRA